MVKYLSYIVVTTPALDAWIKQATEHVGMQVEVVEPGQQIRLRVDEKFQRFVVTRSEAPSTMGMGFEVESDRRLLAIGLVLESIFGRLPAAHQPFAWGYNHEHV